MNCKSARCQYRRTASFRPVVLGVLLAGFSTLCGAQATDGVLGGWRITPRLSVGTTYTDNIRLVPADEAEGDWVWQVDPGISMRKQGGRLDLRLDYTAQGLMYNQNSDANTINNNLSAFGTGELYQDHFFVDAYGSISQVPVTSSGRVDTGGLGSNDSTPSSLIGLFSNVDFGLPGAADLFNPIGIFSNIALTDNQATQSTFGISPYWRQNFGGWANGLLRYRYDDVSYSEFQTPDTVGQGDLSDSQINTVEFNLTSGRQFNRLNWNFNYFYQQQDNGQNNNNDQQASDNTRQESASGQLNYPLNNAWTLVARGGYEESTGYEDSEDGAYWGLGATWTPNRFYSLTGLYGSNFNNLAVQWNPSPRTSLQISRTDQGVGTSPGIYWNGSFSHRTRNSVWSASYTQEVTTSQQLASNSLVGGGVEGQPVVPGGTFELTNQPFLRKYFNASVTYRRGRNDLLFSAFSDSREFQADNSNNEDTYGAGVLWTWRFAPRTASFLGTGWEWDDLGKDQLGEDQQNDYWVSVIGLARVFTPNSGGLISYRYYRNDADPSDQSFRENRFNVRFSLKF